MATWSQEDIDKLKAAIIALASGELVQAIAYDGPPRRQVTYHPADLGAMRKLLAEMTREVGGATSYRRVKWQRGFR